MYPKEFIQGVLIDEFKDVVDRHPYVAFALIAIGIEFIGKCHMLDINDWHEDRRNEPFDKGIDLLSKIDSRYNDNELRNQLRNGFAHTLTPKKDIALSQIKEGDMHFGKSKKGKTILVVEILFSDFVKICKKTIEEEFPENNKMKRPFLNTSES